jgi:hypothetical protein
LAIDGKIVVIFRRVKPESSVYATKISALQQTSFPDRILIDKNEIVMPDFHRICVLISVNKVENRCVFLDEPTMS